MDKKNIAIIALVISLILCFLWGAWGNQYHRIYRADLHTAKEKIVGLELSVQEKEVVVARTVELQEELKVNKQQLKKVREEFLVLNRVNKELENKLNKQDIQLAEFRKKSKTYIDGLQKQLTATQRYLLEKEQMLVKFQKKCKDAILQIEADKIKDIKKAEEKIQLERQKLAVYIEDVKMLKAQITGLKKIIGKRDNVVEELSNTLDIIRINKDVLLRKIGDQNDDLLKLQKDNRALVKKVIDKNKQIADLHEQFQDIHIQ